MEHKNLGTKTLGFLIVKRSGPALLAIVFTIFMIFVFGIAPEEYRSYAGTAVFFTIIATILISGAMVGVALLEYHNYSITILEKSMKITKGILSRYESGVPYRRIRQVDIVRTPVCRLFGISNIIITLVGDEDIADDANEKIPLPYLEKKLAERLQHEILQHAQVEQMRIVSHPEATVG